MSTWNNMMRTWRYLEHQRIPASERLWNFDLHYFFWWSAIVFSIPMAMTTFIEYYGPRDLAIRREIFGYHELNSATNVHETAWQVNKMKARLQDLEGVIRQAQNQNDPSLETATRSSEHQENKTFLETTKPELTLNTSQAISIPNNSSNNSSKKSSSVDQSDLKHTTRAMDVESSSETIHIKDMQDKIQNLESTIKDLSKHIEQITTTLLSLQEQSDRKASRTKISVNEPRD